MKTASKPSEARLERAHEEDAERFRASEAGAMLGISRRQLQYWAQTDLVSPSYRTPGGHHRYGFRDLVALKTAKRLLDAGISVRRIRKSIQALRRMLPEVEHPLSELVLVATGDVVLALHQGSAFEAVSGQEWVFEVARFEREVRAYRRSAKEAAAASRLSPAQARAG